MRASPQTSWSALPRPDSSATDSDKSRGCSPLSPSTWGDRAGPVPRSCPCHCCRPQARLGLRNVRRAGPKGPNVTFSRIESVRCGHGRQAPGGASAGVRHKLAKTQGQAEKEGEARARGSLCTTRTRYELCFRFRVRTNLSCAQGCSLGLLKLGPWPPIHRCDPLAMPTGPRPKP